MPTKYNRQRQRKLRKSRKVRKIKGGELPDESKRKLDEKYVVGGPVPSMNDLSLFVKQNKIEYKAFMDLIDHVKNRLDVTQLSPNAKTEFELYMEEARKQGHTLPPSTAPMSKELYLDQERTMGQRTMLEPSDKLYLDQERSGRY